MWPNQTYFAYQRQKTKQNNDKGWMPKHELILTFYLHVRPTNLGNIKSVSLFHLSRYFIDAVSNPSIGRETNEHKLCT